MTNVTVEVMVRAIVGRFRGELSYAPAMHAQPVVVDGLNRSPIPVISRLAGPGYALAFVAVTLAGFLQAVSAPGELVSRQALGGLALACAAYALLGTAGLYAVERHGSRAQLRGLMGLLTAIGAATTLASHGYTSMMLLAVVSASVLQLGAGSVIVSAVAGLVALFAFATRASLWTAFAQATIAFGSGIAFVIVFSRIALRERRARAEVERLASELATANERLMLQASEVEQLATVRERNRIAREIHDGLGHYLTVVHVQLEAAQALLASAPDRALAALAKAQHLTHEGLNEVRRSVSLLRGSAPARPPLVEALTALAAECSAAGLAADLRLEGSPRRLAEPVEFTLYRAAQEALTNARRHACASRIDLRLEFAAGERVRLCVQDDGAGACEPPRAGGFGLLGLRERAELVGGRVSIRTAPAQGFALELEVPG